MSIKSKGGFFKTKVGAILKGVASIVAPQLVSALEGVGSVKDALSVIQGSGESEETKVMLRELTLKEYEAEVMDRASAREREVKVLEHGGSNVMMYVIGWGIIGAFFFLCLVGLGYVPMPEDLDRDIFMFVAGNIVALTTMVVAYFYGSSRGSAIKTNLLTK